MIIMISGVRAKPYEFVTKIVGPLRSLESHLHLQYIILTGIIVFGMMLRLFKLGEWSFWGDEFITVRNALNLNWESAPFAPLSLTLTKIFIEIAGVSETTARIASAAIGVLTIPVLFLFARKMTNSYVALIVSLLLAVAPWHLYWSQNARFYTALLLFFTIALYFFYLALEDDRISYLLLSMAFLFFSLQERLLAAFFIPVVVIYIVLIRILPFSEPPGLRWRNLAIFFVPGLLGAAYIILTNPAIRDLSRWETAFSFVNNSPVWLVGGFVFYLGIPIVCLAAVGSIRLLTRWNRLGLMLTLAATLPIIALVVLSLFHYTANRYAFVSVTSILFLAAFALYELITALEESSAKLIGLAVLVLVLLSGLADNFLYFQYQNGNRDDWRSAFAYIEQHQFAGDRVVTTHHELADYYLGRDTISMMAIDDVEEFMAREGRTWFVIDLTTADKSPRMYNWIIDNTKFETAFDVTVGARTWPMRVYIYDW
jgi:mannosyltransferase